MRSGILSRPARAGALGASAILLCAWLLSSTAAVLPASDFVLLALAAQFQTYGTFIFARHGDAGGLLALAITLGLLVFVGATGAVLIASMVLTLWIAFPASIQARYWLHTYLPIVMPAVLMVLASLALGRAVGGWFLDVDLPLEKGWSRVALVVVLLMVGALTIQAMRIRAARSPFRGNAYAALAAALACAAAVAIVHSSLGLVASIAWYAACLGAAWCVQGLVRNQAGTEAS